MDNKAVEEWIESCDMWSLRRMLKISLTAKIKNEDELQKAGVQR